MTERDSESTASWVHAADTVCKRFNAGFRADWARADPGWQATHRWSSDSIRLYARVAARSQRMTGELMTELHGASGSLPSFMIKANALNAKGWRQLTLATSTRNRGAFQDALLTVDKGSEAFVLLAVLAGSPNCADDTYTSARSTASQRTAFRASAEARWMCVEQQGNVPPSLRAAATGDLRTLASLNASSPGHRVSFVASVLPPTTYGELATAAAAALGAPPCQSDAELQAVRGMLLDSGSRPMSDSPGSF